MLIAAAIMLSACSGKPSNTAQSGQSAAPSASSATAATTTKPPIQEGKQAGAKLTGACPLLTADEVEQILGQGKSDTQLTAKEGKPDTATADHLYTCDYSANGKSPFELSAGNITEDGFGAADAIDAFAKDGKKVKRLSGIGDGAVYLQLKNGTAFVATARTSHGELRTATFAAPAVVPQQILAEVLKVVAERL